MRVALTILLPLLLPSIVYFTYAFLAGDDRRNAQAVPWFWLLATGLVLAVIALIVLATLGGAEPGSVYHPPREVDGRVLPGYFGPDEEEPGQ